MTLSLSQAEARIAGMGARTATLEQWHDALAHAIRDGAVDAIPAILVRMARDGWPAEAEEARQAMAIATAAAHPELGLGTGHDRSAAAALEVLAGVYRRSGVDGVRDAVDGYFRMSSPEQDVALVTEAVLQLARRAARR